MHLGIKIKNKFCKHCKYVWSKLCKLFFYREYTLYSSSTGFPDTVQFVPGVEPLQDEPELEPELLLVLGHLQDLEDVEADLEVRSVLLPLQAGRADVPVVVLSVLRRRDSYTVYCIIPGATEMGFINTLLWNWGGIQNYSQSQLRWDSKTLPVTTEVGFINTSSRNWGGIHKYSQVQLRWDS